MPGQPKLYAPGALQHVMGRGIDGIKIFINRKDREDFLERLADLCRADAPKSPLDSSFPQGSLCLDRRFLASCFPAYVSGTMDFNNRE